METFRLSIWVQDAHLVRDAHGVTAEVDRGSSDLRDTMALGHDDLMTEILDRAVERGEADRDKLTPRIVRLPADLFRLELLMTFRPIPDDDIVEIVDTIFLPLVGGRAAA